MAVSKQVADILHEYQQEVMQHQQAYEAKLNSDSDIARYARRIGQLGMEKLGETLAGNETTQIDRRLKDLEQQREKRIAWLGLHQYLCPRCRDTGYLHGDFCVCMRRRIYAGCYGVPDLSGPGPTLTDYPYEILDDTVQQPSQATSRELARLSVNALQRIIAQYPNDGRGMIIHGFTGVGKTHLVMAGAREAYRAGLDVLFIHAADMHDLYLHQRLGGGVTLRYLETSGLLILDDLGTEPLTRNVTREALNHLLEVRYERKLPTVITTNEDDLHGYYGERIASRLHDRSRFTFAKLYGVDLRTGKAHQPPQQGSKEGQPAPEARRRQSADDAGNRRPFQPQRMERHYGQTRDWDR